MLSVVWILVDDESESHGSISESESEKDQPEESSEGEVRLSNFYPLNI